MDAPRKLHPMDADNIKIFATRVANATKEEVLAAWNTWKDRYSKNQTLVMRSRLAKIASPDKENDYEDRRGHSSEEYR